LTGVTSSTTELNILTGVTATATELNLLDGVTSLSTVTNLDGLSDVKVDSTNHSMWIGEIPSSTSTAEYNVVIGIGAADDNTIYGDENTIIGYNAFSTLGSGSNNVAIGSNAMAGLQPQCKMCTAIGSNCMAFTNTTAFLSNVAIGHESMGGNSISGAKNNVAIGNGALYNLTTGDYNTIIGSMAQENGYSSTCSITAGSNNVHLGFQAGETHTTCNNNVIIGSRSKGSAVDSENQIVIGYNVTGTGHNEVALGNASITAIKAHVTSITAYSDERIKKDVKDNTLGLSFIANLRPVSYKKVNPADYPEPLLEEKYKKVDAVRPVDDEKTYDGLIAQEVKATLTELGKEWSGHSIDQNTGKQGLQYGGLVVPLINAVKELSAENDTLKAALEALTARVSALE
jgi:hypothetical protein